MGWCGIGDFVHNVAIVWTIEINTENTTNLASEQTQAGVSCGTPATRAGTTTITGHQTGMEECTRRSSNQEMNREHVAQSFAWRMYTTMLQELHPSYALRLHLPPHVPGETHADVTRTHKGATPRKACGMRRWCVLGVLVFCPGSASMVGPGHTGAGGIRPGAMQHNAN